MEVNFWPFTLCSNAQDTQFNEKQAKINKLEVKQRPAIQRKLIKNTIYSGVRRVRPDICETHSWNLEHCYEFFPTAQRPNDFL
jgi:hypothetical protein